MVQQLNPLRMKDGSNWNDLITETIMCSKKNTQNKLQAHKALSNVIALALAHLKIEWFCLIRPYTAALIQ